MTPSTKPRYDRIVSLVLLVIIGMAVIFVIDLSPATFRVLLGGDLPVITVSWLLIASLVLVTSTGADVFIRAHPTMQTRSLPTLRLGRFELEFAPGFWILPSLSIITSFGFFRLFSAALQSLAIVIALGAAGVLLLVSFIAQHYALDRATQVRERAQLVLQITTYALAFAGFSAIYYARLRFLYGGVLVGTLATLLAYALLQWSAQRKGLLALSACIGVALGETMWALNYWATPFLLGGLTLLVIFYIASGTMQHYLQQRLSRQVLVEYGVLGSALLAGVVFFTFR
ncbi:MAG: hypothetical protein H7Z42_04960 [Roseiflexaceae bacterium]|nr:hypothetical protein [Roseiflexaceae bacterium]